MVYYNIALTITGNDPGAMSNPTIAVGIIMTIGGCLLNANVFGTISNIFQQMNAKEQKYVEQCNLADNLMYNLKLDKPLQDDIRQYMLHTANQVKN
jgi:hypothetical protein